MQKTFLIAGALFGALAVGLGALAAHALERVVDDRTFRAFHTGVEYQFYHALALLGVGILYSYFPNVWTLRSGWCFIIGIVLFSGSLYAITLLKWAGGSIGYGGILTPIGGLFFIAGWISLLMTFLSKGN
jgi:uncharacterized membrane protein YgdD (TMEM256/DUF423 family)